MSGHSKWSTIKRAKGAQDAKKAKVFTKVAREIMVAVKEGGGGDPSVNSRLAAAVAKAKAVDMPKDSIKRTIEKALGSGGSDSFERITYEGCGPRGVAVIVDVMTDNRNRTAAEVRLIFDKYGGNMGTTGCVSWQFDRKGVIVIDNEDNRLDEDAVLNDALEAGADDIETDEGGFVIYTTPEGFLSVSGALESLNHSIMSAQVELVPQNYITLTEPDDIKNMEKILELLDDCEDVQDVWHNAIM